MLDTTEGRRHAEPPLSVELSFFVKDLAQARPYCISLFGSDPIRLSGFLLIPCMI